MSDRLCGLCERTARWTANNIDNKDFVVAIAKYKAHERAPREWLCLDLKTCRARELSGQTLMTPFADRALCAALLMCEG